MAACLLLSGSARDNVHVEYKPDRNKSAARLALDIAPTGGEETSTPPPCAGVVLGVHTCKPR